MRRGFKVLVFVFLIFAKVFGSETGDKPYLILEAIDSVSYSDKYLAKELVDSVLLSPDFSYLSKEDRIKFYLKSADLTLKIYKSKPQVFSALADARKAEQLGSVLGDYKLQFQSLDLISGCFLSLGNLYRDSANQYIRLSSEKIPYIEKVGDSLACTGDLLYTKGLAFMNEDLDSAISLFHRAEEVFKEVKNADGVARCYYNVSVCYESKSDVELIADEMAIMMIDSALLYVEKASEQFFQLGEEDRIANCLKAKGNYYIYRFYRSQLLGDLDSAILFHKQAIHNFSNESCLSLYRIGEAFHWKYTMWEKNGSLNLLEKDSAIYYYVNSIEEGTNQQNKPCLEFGLDGYLTLVEKVKSDDNVLNNTLSGLKKISEDEKLSLQGSEAEFRNFRLALQQKENARKQNLFLTGAGIILAILTALVLIFYQRIRIRHLKLQLRSRLEALRAQVDPHFISNCLNAIELLINENKPKEASEYLIEFSRLCRGILYSTNNESINLAQEIDYLKNYMSLEQLRIGDKLDYEFIVSPGLVPSIITIPTLLIQPFIENAIWHGIQKKEEGGKVSVGFSKIVDKQGEVVLYCTVEDNGIGRQASMNMEEESLIKKEGSYGLTITDERFQILDKIRKAKYEITDLYERNQPKGTLVEIWLPII